MVDIFVITSNDSLINWFDGNKTKKQLRTKRMILKMLKRTCVFVRPKNTSYRVRSMKWVKEGNLYISRSRKNVAPWKGLKPGCDFLRLTGQQKSTRKSQHKTKVNTKQRSMQKNWHKTKVNAKKIDKNKSQHEKVDTKQKPTQKKRTTQNKGQHKTNQHKTWVVQTMKMAYHLWTTFSPNFWVDVKTLLGFLSVLRPSSVSFLTGKYPIGSWRWAPLLYFLLSKSFLFISFHLSLIRYAARTRFKHHKFGWSVKLLKNIMII